MEGLFAPSHLLIILIIVMFVFGPKRIPEMARSLGKGLREFKSATSGLADDVRSGLGEEPQPVADIAAPEPAGAIKAAPSTRSPSRKRPSPPARNRATKR